MLSVPGGVDRSTRAPPDSGLVCSALGSQAQVESERPRCVRARLQRQTSRIVWYRSPRSVRTYTDGPESPFSPASCPIKRYAATPSGRDVGLWKAELCVILDRIGLSGGAVELVDMSLADARAWIERD